MKDKILYLILGILIGAVITAGAFLIFQKNAKPQLPRDFKDMNFNGERHKNGNFENMVKNGEISEMPEGEKNQDTGV